MPVHPLLCARVILCCQGKLPIVPAQAAQLHNLSRLAQGLQEVVEEVLVKPVICHLVRMSVTGYQERGAFSHQLFEDGLQSDGRERVSDLELIEVQQGRLAPRECLLDSTVSPLRAVHVAAAVAAANQAPRCLCEYDRIGAGQHFGVGRWRPPQHGQPVAPGRQLGADGASSGRPRRPGCITDNAAAAPSAGPVVDDEAIFCGG
mmetsp:Transcript_11346/g.34101  ORF Transcript_11346/g.34101 Transcript_11346/m.34101 type:complete len:204 (+) Transcript_11346:135-746(+)